MVTFPLSLTEVDASRWFVFCPLTSDEEEKEDVETPWNPVGPAETVTKGLSSPPKRVSTLGESCNKLGLVRVIR